MLGAAAALSMLSPVGGDVGKLRLDDIRLEAANLEQYTLVNAGVECG